MTKKTIWITGGSTGIGKALAIKFASKGWNVAISARRAELLNELSNSYENISGFPLDVTNKEKCKEVFNEIKNKYENIIQMDADLSHNPKDLPRMVKNLKNNDLVIGSRYINGISVVNWPLRRLMLSYGANAYSRIITGMPIMDGTGGFKAWKAKVLSDIDLDSIKSQGYSFQIEMNFRAWRLNARIKEVPIIFVHCFFASCFMLLSK